MGSRQHFSDSGYDVADKLEHMGGCRYYKSLLMWEYRLTICVETELERMLHDALKPDR